MNALLVIIGKIVVKFHTYIDYCIRKYYESQLGYLGVGARFDPPASIVSPHKIYIHENSHISRNAQFIISRYGESGKFIMKKNSGAAQALTVVTGNHKRIAGMIFKDAMKDGAHDENLNIIIEEDVLISSNVTLLAGAHIGRGATIGAGAVVRHEIPPYSIVLGNPAKIVGFSLRPEEIIEHEMTLYSEAERISLDVLDKNYNKFFLSRLKEIKNFNKL